MADMRKIASLFLLTCYSLALLQFYFPILKYNANKGYIANVLCENKSKPSLHCDGKCYLKKELQKSAKEQNNKSSSSVTFIGEFKILSSNSIVLPEPQSIELHYGMAIGHTAYAHSFVPAIFHPPLV